MSPRIVVDTNVLVSGLILPFSVSAAAFAKAVRKGTILASNETLDELTDVLSPAKFDRYLTLAERKQFLDVFLQASEVVPILHHIRACRDPKDDKFLALAVNGEANLIITGDQDLLTLNPFQKIPIITPAEYLES